MSYDIVFVPAQLSDGTIRDQSSRADGLLSERARRPLNLDAVAALQEVLRRVCPEGPDRNDLYAIEFDDGGSARVQGGNLARGCRVSISGLTPDICRFLYSFLQAGGWVMLPVTEPKIAITATKDPKTHIADGFAPIVCETCDDLSIVLVVGVDAWHNCTEEA